MPWDMFCPQCSATLVADILPDTDEEIAASIAEYNNSVVYCDWCRIYVDFNTHKVITLGQLEAHIYGLLNTNGISKVEVIYGG